MSVDGQSQEISVPFPSPKDWRDTWIYFLVVDRFNNPVQSPASTLLPQPIPFDAPFAKFQGCTFNGVRQKLGYIQDLGAGAMWLSPVLKNCQYETGTELVGHMLAPNPRWGIEEQARLKFVNGFYATLERQNGTCLSEPLEKIIITWDDANNRLKVIVKV